MDEIEKLALMVKAEDEAAQKLWEAKRKVQDSIRDNVVKFMDSGVITIKVNRRIMQGLIGQPRSSVAFR